MLKRDRFVYLYANRPVCVHNIYNAEFYSNSQTNLYNLISFSMLFIFVRDVDKSTAEAVRTSRVPRGFRFLIFVRAIAIYSEIKKIIKFCFSFFFFFCIWLTWIKTINIYILIKLICSGEVLYPNNVVIFHFIEYYSVGNVDVSNFFFFYDY